MAKGPSKFDPLEFTTLVAHQLQSPIATAAQLIRTLLGGYQGPLTDAQKEFVAKAAARCDQAMETVRRMLTIAKAMQGADVEEGPSNLAALARAAHQKYAPEAAERGISFDLDVEDDAVHVPFSRAAMVEVFDAILGNAFKYTPDQGHIRLSLHPLPQQKLAHLSLSDSGVGIEPRERERIFEPFYRSRRAKATAQAGTGLGLSFVKAIVEAGGGRIWADQSDLGGAQITLELTTTEEPEAPTGAPDHGMKVLIIGGVAAGPKVASKVIRLDPKAEVTIVEKGKFLSYAGCGLPYYIAGVVKSQKQLMSTPVGVVRDAVFFQKVHNVHVQNDTEAVGIDRAAKRVRVRDLLTGVESLLAYDKLVLATGATPIVPKLPGSDLLNIFTLHGVQDAEGIKAALADTEAKDVVMVGGGLIGVEFTGSLAARGCRVTIVERLGHILPILDSEMARLVERHLESHGVRVMTNTNTQRFEGDTHVRAVVTDHGALPADLVILGIGVRPNVRLAREAGLEIGQTGGVKVDERMRTSDPDIYAAGDCVESHNLVTRRPCYLPMGSLANKHGRVVAVNICGGDERFPGVLGSTVCKVFDYCVGRTGLTGAQARRDGYEVVIALAPGPDTEHFMPNAQSLMLKLVVDAKTRRLLGAQGAGRGHVDKRIDVAAIAITAGMTVDQIANVDLPYAPQYSPAMDNLITAANVARNKLDGYLVGASAEEVSRMIQEEKDFIFLDVRTPGEYEQVRLPGSMLIPLGTLRSRIDELPRDKEIVTFDNISLRGYEAALILKAHGFEKVRVLDGGIEMWPYRKLE